MKPLGELTVRDLMTGSPVCAGAQESVPDVLLRMAECAVSAIPVTDPDDVVVGVLSLVDLLGVVVGEDTEFAEFASNTPQVRELVLGMGARRLARAKVAEVMTPGAETVEERTNAAIAARMMVQGRFRHLPVVDECDEVVGMLTATDFVRAFAEHAPLLAG